MYLCEKQMAKTSLLRTIYTSEPEKIDRKTGMKLKQTDLQSSRSNHKVTAAVYVHCLNCVTTKVTEKRDCFQSYIICLKS